ncbi:serotransferrin-like [Dendronephthya gigantea]|uniref:serotransferrin-like n=1 Tax=Dendronephthya gigantea TaxID=151771 RepID=UPI00106D34FB|nr:serotransferrin-like [Dendronephthya gigantea]
MNFLFVACVSLLVSSVVADSDSPKFCSSNATKCNLAGINVTCVESSDCTKEVAEGKADLTYASANNMIKNVDKLQIVLSQQYVGVPEKYVLYYGLAVVKKDTTFNLKQLKGKDSCHTGVRRTVGWNIPVGYLLYIKEMPLINDQYESVSKFFGKTCAPGADKIVASESVKKDLCSLCLNEICSTTASNTYLGYVGAFKCMADGNNDRVGFVKQTTADEYIKKYGGKREDFKLLCTDGTTKSLDDFQSCNIDKRPIHAIVTRSSKSAKDVKKYQTLFKNASLDDLKAGGMVFNGTKSLETYPKTLEDYLKPYSLHYNEVQKTNKVTKGPKFCGDATKCNSVKDKVHVTCVEASSGSNCVKDVVEGKADFMLANANDMVDNQGKLKIVRSQKLKDLEKYVQYYGLAVVKKETAFNFKQLKDKYSCHTGVGRTVGWVIPVGYLLDEKEMPLIKDQYKSVAEFFKKSCVPGIGKISSASQAVKDDLCSLCDGTENVKCTSNDPFAGYEGAFKCMAAGNNDRVGFVKQDTANKVLNSSGSYGSKNDYKLLCTDGKSKPLDEYRKCYIGTRPANALVTSKDKSNDTVAKIEDSLKMANLPDLVKAGIVDGNIESLEEYSNTVEKYVEKYAKYRSALLAKESSAPSIFVPFIVKVLAVFASIVVLL